MRKNVLKLNSSWEAVGIIDWTDAVRLIYERKVEVVEIDGTIGTVSGPVDRPSVIVLKKTYKHPHRRLAWSRPGVLRRDNYTCAYCGHKGDKHDMTIDHIIPESRYRAITGGDNPNNWTNTCACCPSCNFRKGNKLLSECGMVFLNPEFKRYNPAGMWELELDKIPEKWEPYLVKRSKVTV